MHVPLKGASRRAVAAILLLAALLAGCGSSKKTASSSAGSGSTASQATSAPATLALDISEAGKSAKYTGAGSVSGGLVTIKLTNSGKAPHGAQLVRILGGHSVQQALAAVGAAQTTGKTVSWVRAEGGIGIAEPGSTVSATVSLPGGSYVIVDAAAAEGGSGPPAVLPLSVSAGQTPAVPVTGTTITAASSSKDHFKWQIGGPLKVGTNDITFVSKGTNTLHEISAVRITGNQSTAQLVKALSTNGPPPSYVDLSSRVQTAVLDSGKSLATQVAFTKPGTYVLFCHLTDRDGGKPHFQEGLITKVTVK